MLVLMPLVTSIYISTGGHFGIRILVASLCLLPPTMAMGATLATVAGWIDASRTGMSKVGFLYAGNLAGAVTGSLVAGFYLLRVFDVYVATFVAASLNLATAAVALRLARAAGGHGLRWYRRQLDSDGGETRPGCPWAIYIVDRALWSDGPLR